MSVRALPLFVLLAAACGAPVAPAGVGNNTTPSGTNTPAAESVKIGVVDPQAILDLSESGKAASKELEAFASARRKLLEDDQKVLKQMEQQLSEATKLSDAQKKKQEAKFRAMYADYQTKAAELQRKSVEFERELVAKQRELLSDHRKKIRAATRVIAEKHSLSIVFNKGGEAADQIIYSEGVLDITAEVLSELNRASQ